MPSLKNFPSARFTARAQSPSVSGSSSHNTGSKVSGISEAPCGHATFQSALDFQMKKHRDTSTTLIDAVSPGAIKQKIRSLRDWRTGKNVPRRKSSLELLRNIEQRYELPNGYFAKLIAESNPTYKRKPCRLGPFHAALNFHMREHGDSSLSLASAVARSGEGGKAVTITHWKTGKCLPQHRTSFVLLERIELHYGLPVGYFTELIARPELATRRALKQVNPSLRTIFHWHLPADFELRPEPEQKEIIGWISNNVLGSATEFGKYQSKATRYGFSIVFPTIDRSRGGREPNGKVLRPPIGVGKSGGYGTIEAPPRLAAEMENLIAFKTAILPPAQYRRYLRWSSATAQQSARNYGLLFGALTAAPLSPAEGFGLALKKLTFGLLVFPAIWDWYLLWRERRRGFFTAAEKSMLYEAKGALRRRVGWIRQHPELAKRLCPIEGLISKADIEEASADWSAACDKAMAYILDRIPELLRIARVHRDPFEAILPVLEAESPMGEYKKIADEILRLMPNETQAPLDTAFAVRSYLLIRFAMHLGLRQRNLRELLLCRRDDKPRSIRKLEELRRGEIRWNDEAVGWEVFIPAIAFKNAGSSFFKGRPFRMLLPDLENLTALIDSYVDRHRSVLLNGYPDPDTFFVRSARSSKRSTCYDLFGFYAAWKFVIQRYGIFNPYTRRGAIAGLLPHGPHSVRDIIATHILKQTESYELASFAIQDTVEAVVRHYTRFLPHEKTARAAAVLNQVWRQNV